jgi:CheY-like chemotaxis protein
MARTEAFAGALSAPHWDPPARVLLIEDDALNRQLVAELLAMRGRGQLRLTQAPDLRSGLARLREQSYDLVLLDTRLPEASALHALRAVGALAPKSRIVPHDGYLSPQARSEAAARGCYDVVVRGELNALWRALNDVLLGEGR